MFVYVLHVRDLTTGNFNDLTKVVSTLCLRINNSILYLGLWTFFALTALGERGHLLRAREPWLASLGFFWPISVSQLGQPGQN